MSLDHLPDWLRELGPYGLAWWQWGALPLALAFAWFAGFLLGRLTRALLTLLVKRTPITWDDALLARMGGPLTLAWTVGVLRAQLSLLVLPQDTEAVISKGLMTALFVAFFWFVMRAVAVTGQMIGVSTWSQMRPASRSLILIGTRIAQIGVVTIGVVAVLADLGYPVASLVAGLGIGGLAVALAGQKTIENLFGAFSIGVDQPMRVGDFVKVEDTLGTVEDIGLRSTRIRTLDRTLVTIPNGKLAEMRIESYAVRDRIRLACTLGLVFGTTAAQLREVMAGVEAVLRRHPRIWPDTVVVSFVEIGSFCLNIEVMAWFQTSDFDEFRVYRQEVQLQMMEVVEKAGTSFAFPTRTVHVVQDGGPRARPNDSGRL